MILLLGAGCTTTNSEKPVATNEGKTADASFPRKIKHLKGETAIQSRPQKIATPYISLLSIISPYWMNIR
jgi:iron complex transport system substrate-binding protein